MRKGFDIKDGQIVPSDDPAARVLLFVDPDDAEKRAAIDLLGIDEFTLHSALDPEEQAHVDIEPGYLCVVYKRPRNYSGSDKLVFKVATAGLFLVRDHLVIVARDDVDFLQNKAFRRVSSPAEVMLRLMQHSVSHYLEHLKVIVMISDELENKIVEAMENRYLINMFSLEKSLVYYVNAIGANTGVLEKIKSNSARLGLTPDECDLVDNILLDNQQCFRQADMYSNILASMMNARASIVANNLNVIMKVLSLITVAIMVPNLVVSLFSMNVRYPFTSENPFAFYLILATAIGSIFAFLVLKKRFKW